MNQTEFEETLRRFGFEITPQNLKAVESLIAYQRERFDEEYWERRKHYINVVCPECGEEFTETIDKV